MQPDGGEALAKSETQGRPREGPSRATVQQSHDPTNRNRTRGRDAPDEWAGIREVHIHQGPPLKSAGCAVKGVWSLLRVGPMRDSPRASPRVRALGRRPAGNRPQGGTTRRHIRGTLGGWPMKFDGDVHNSC